MIRKIKWFLIFIVVFLTVDIGRYALYPDVSKLAKENPIPTAFMQYRLDQWESEGKQKKLDQRWVSIGAVSPYVVKAVLISEDDGFYNHEGFEVKDLEVALEKNIKAGKFVAGGSTVSQQLAKNIYLSPSKNPIRKIKEAILTHRMEKALTKRRILELYLNCAEWGDGIFGIEAAARHYYGKSARNLGPKEAAQLAAILPNPIIYQPNQGGRVAKKTAILMNIMQKRGLIIKAYEEVSKPEPNEPTAKEPQEDINVSDEQKSAETPEANATN